MNEPTIKIIHALVIIPICFAFAWIPMLAWNNSVAQMFEVLPEITYIQAFWLSALLSYTRTGTLKINE